MAREPTIAIQSESDLSFDSRSIKEAARILGVFDQPVCLKLLLTIEALQPVSFVTLCKKHGGEKVFLTQFIDQLVQTQFITERRNGRSLLYCVNNERLRQVQSAARTFFDPTGWEVTIR